MGLTDEYRQKLNTEELKTLEYLETLNKPKLWNFVEQVNKNLKPNARFEKNDYEEWDKDKTINFLMLCKRFNILNIETSI